MSSNLLTNEAQNENATTLAAALGLSHADAAQALDISILLTADPADSVALQVTSHIETLLKRTVHSISSSAGTHGNCTVEVIVGSALPKTSGSKLYVKIREDLALISQEALSKESCASIHPILLLLTACYVSAATLHCALGNKSVFQVPEPLFVRFDQLGIDLNALGQSINIEHTYLAGAGAIGNGFLWAARHLDLTGRLEIVDDDCVSSGNLNRQMWFDTDDLELFKANRLVAKAQPFFPRLVLVPRTHRLQDLAERSNGPWLQRLVVAVDSRRSRRALQNEFPREVFDASTTDIREIVLHYHLQPTELACLSCIYEPDEEEFSREQHIADHLGISVDEVRTERISEPVAQSIAAKFPEIAANMLVGTAYDTLFKKLCAEGLLRTQIDRTIVAPFAFVSVLAGTLLAIELVRRLGNGVADREFNYWRVSPWQPLFGRRRVLRPRQQGCPFCSNPILQKVNTTLWD